MDNRDDLFFLEFRELDDYSRSGNVRSLFNNVFWYGSCGSTFNYLVPPSDYCAVPCKEAPSLAQIRGSPPSPSRDACHPCDDYSDRPVHSCVQRFLSGRKRIPHLPLSPSSSSGRRGSRIFETAITLGKIPTPRLDFPHSFCHDTYTAQDPLLALGEGVRVAVERDLILQGVGSVISLHRVCGVGPRCQPPPL